MDRHKCESICRLSRRAPRSTCAPSMIDCYAGSNQGSVSATWWSCHIEDFTICHFRHCMMVRVILLSEGKSPLLPAQWFCSSVSLDLNHSLVVRYLWELVMNEFLVCNRSFTPLIRSSVKSSDIQMKQQPVKYYAQTPARWTWFILP